MRNSGHKYQLNIVTMMSVLLGVMLTAPIAFAQPANDDIVNATVVTGVPFADGPIDTSGATTAVDDPQDCHNNGSNWYTFTPAADISIEVNTIGSDYDTTLGVYASSPDGLSLIGCNDDLYGLQSAVRFEATANTTYFVMVGFCCGIGAPGGGTLFFNVLEPPPPPTVDITVNRVGQVNTRTGVATISGTYTCTNSDFIEVFGDARQNVGRFTIDSGFFFFDSGTCDGTPHTWAVEVVPRTGKFAGGKAMTQVSAFSCDPFFCANGFVEQTVQLRGSGE